VRALAVSVGAFAVVVAGCSWLPQPADVAPQLTHGSDRTGTTFTMSPWPYDGTRVFLCLHDPGEAFTGGGIAPAAAACLPLTVRVDGNRVTARLDVAQLAKDVQARLTASTRPWFFAISGSRGASAQALVMSIDDSPIPSDPGPS